MIHSGRKGRVLMTENIGRNEPCPCGSGKKYKKCCGAKEAVSITHVLENEMEELQKNLIHYALNHYEDEVFTGFEEYQDYFEIEEEELQFYEFVYTIWFSLFYALEDGETILKEFISSQAGKLKRPKLKQILQSWTEARTIAGEITHVENNALIVVDGFTSEKYDVVLPNNQRPFEAGSFFLGFLLPFDQKHIFFPAPFDLPELPLREAIDFIELKSQAAGYDSPQEFLADFFMELMRDLTMVGGQVDIEGLDWKAPVYKEVAELLKKNLVSLGEATPIVDLGIILWYQFCEKKQKKIKKPNLYAAALHYLLSTFNHMISGLTQKEIANMYNVPVGSLSSTYREMDDELEEEIRKVIEISLEEDELDNPLPAFPFNALKGPLPTEQAMHEALADIQNHNFESIEEINDFLNRKLSSSTPKKQPKTNKERAQQLVYDAMEAQGPKRYKLAEEAIKLDPNCVDAYVILIENSKSLQEALLLSEKAMKIGEKELGKAFFVENKGHFWGLFETRPYMRAKAQYADALYQLGKVTEAIQQYEEILVLNPNDNLGARYMLFALYLDKGELSKAEKLLNNYEEETAHGLYNKLLLELFKNGFNTKAAKLLKEAKQQNPSVIPFLTGKKRLPKHMPDYHGWGDEDEAVIYLEEHLHLWKKIDGLQEWLKKH
jgi:tetratricopeptide (TPR) repeat protein